MHRLRGFDYKRPFFYMVTLKRLPELAAFSQISDEAKPPGWRRTGPPPQNGPAPQNAQGRQCCLVENEITKAFARVIREFAAKWWGLWPIDCFVIMPDHIHLLIRIKDTGDQMPLGSYVYQLMKALAGEYWCLTGQAPQNARCLTGPAPQNAGQRTRAAGMVPERMAADGTAAAKRAGTAKQAGTAKRAGAASSAPIPPVFERAWHDWIVKKEGQLAAFTRYIRENPERAWLRRVNRRYFGKVCKVSFLGREWFAYGNVAILDLPILMAVKGHRAAKPGTPEWNALVDSCSRIGPGGAGVGTFMSPLEKECGNAIARAGGKWIVLSPEGFHERWHPPREKERFCAEGRMLFLSLWPPMERQPTKQELYQRCHEMGDIVVEGLMAAGMGRDGARRRKTGRRRKTQGA